MRQAVFATLCLVAVACGSKEDEATPAAAPEQNAAPPQKGAPGPGGRSAVPTVDEWAGVTKEVTVKGSSALNCETKMVREWLRVSCRGKNDTGGTPTTVEVTRGGGGNVFKFASGGVTSLVVPYVDGLQLEAVFSWTDKKSKLSLQWPHGAPMPPALGSFATP